MKIAALVIGFVLCVSHIARADEVTFTIETTNGATAYKAPLAPIKSGDTLKIICPTNCNELLVVQGTNTLKAKGASSPSPWTSAVPISKDSGIVAVAFGGTDLPLRVSDAQPQSPPPVPLAIPRLACPTEAKDNTIVVDTTGSVLLTSVEKFTEDDTLAVWVAGPDNLVDDIRVERRSAFRDVMVLRIQGDPSSITGKGKESAGAPTYVCKRTFLADFSPGRGQFALVRSDGTTLAQFEFAVRPVFDGMFTVGFVATWLVDRTYSLRSDGVENHIVQDPASDYEGRFALMYSAFLPITKVARVNPEWNRYFGLTAGVLLHSPTKNVLFGINVGPFNGLSLVFGGHLGAVTVLDGVKPDDTLPLEATSVPTTTDWQTKWFVGANIDITVATKLFFGGFAR